MKLIDLLPAEQRRDLRRLRKRLAKRQYVRRVREERKLLCVGVDLSIDAGTCGRFVHAGYLRCIHCTRRRWWLLKHAFNLAEVSVAAMFEHRAADSDALYGVPRWLLSRSLTAGRKPPGRKPPRRDRPALGRERGSLRALEPNRIRNDRRARGTSIDARHARSGEAHSRLATVQRARGRGAGPPRRRAGRAQDSGSRYQNGRVAP